jgi:glycosyltransferase involved in cell wall biosynthesis
VHEYLPDCVIKMVLKKFGKFFSQNDAKPKFNHQAALVSISFDAAFYLKKYPDVAGTNDLLGHYLRQGWREGKDPTEWFSVKAYLETYPDVDADEIDPFYHYLAHGKLENRKIAPAEGSEAAAVRAFFGATGLYLADFPHQFRTGAYAIGTGMSDANRWQVLAHFINHGLYDGRLIALAQPGSTLLVAIGDLALEGDRGKALRCYQLAVEQGEPDSYTFHKLGDCHLHFEQLVEARNAYFASVELGSNDYWAFYNLGHINSKLGQFDKALLYLEEASLRWPAKRAVKYEHRRVLTERFDVEWANANGFAVIEDDVSAAAAMLKTVTDYKKSDTRKHAPIPFLHKRAGRRLRVAIFGSDSIPQCKLYRITQKIDQLAFVGQKVDFYSLTQSEEFEKKIPFFDVVIIYRAPATPEVIEILNSAQLFGVTTFYDIDDLIFDDSCYPPSRAALRDMISPSEYAGLVTGRTLFRQAMAMCDYGIASTPPLQAVMERIVLRKQCFLSPNALGRAHLDLPVASWASAIAWTRRRSDRHGQSAANNKFVLFYGSGSRSHDANFSLMANAVATILRRYPEAELHVIGPITLGIEFTDLKGQIVQQPFNRQVAEYWRELAAADVNLAPLTKGPFNDAKSEIKWMEAALLGIPSVVSSSAVYDVVISNGHDGFLARNEHEWASVLERLITDRSLGTAVGATARTRVLADYGLQQGGNSLATILRSGFVKIDEELAAQKKRKPLVLVVNIFYPPDFIGGATRVVEQTITDFLAIERDRFDFEVLCGREPDGKPGLVERYHWNGVPVTSIMPFPDVDGAERSAETEAFFQTFLDFVYPDIIHFHCIQRLSASLIDVAVAKGIPFVVSAHDGWWISDRQFLIDDEGTPVYETGKWGNPQRLQRLRASLNSAHATLAVSEAQARIYRDRGITNVITVANGSETLSGVKSPPDSGPVWLGLLGGLGLAKGSDLLSDVLKLRTYQNIRFLIVDHSMQEGRTRVEHWGNNKLEIVGKSSFENVTSIYGRLHGLLAISVCVESFGLVSREAQRLGRWVIASNRGGMGEDVIDSENGFIIDPSSMDDLIAVLDTIDADPSTYRSPPNKIIRLRDREDVASDLVTIYRSILEGNPPVAHDIY